MDLALSFDQSVAKREQFLWVGVISRQLGKLEAHQTQQIDLQLVPLTCGLKVTDEREKDLREEELSF